MKLEKQKSQYGSTSFFILVDGECKGTVKKVSNYHHGYRAQETWYRVWMGKKINLSPDVYWGDLFRVGKGVLFKQALTNDRKSFAETGHKVRKRMMDWIKQYLATEEEDCWAEFDQRMKPVTE